MAGPVPRRALGVVVQVRIYRAAGSTQDRSGDDEKILGGTIGRTENEISCRMSVQLGILLLSYRMQSWLSRAGGAIRSAKINIRFNATFPLLYLRNIIRTFIPEEVIAISLTMFFARGSHAFKLMLEPRDTKKREEKRDAILR